MFKQFEKLLEHQHHVEIVPLIRIGKHIHQLSIIVYIQSATLFIDTIINKNVCESSSKLDSQGSKGRFGTFSCSNRHSRIECTREQVLPIPGRTGKKTNVDISILFLFQKGTLAERRFQSVQKGVISKQPGVWFPKGVPDVRHNRERSQKQDIMLPRQASEGSNKSDVSRPIVPNSRTTKADENNDITSLDRKLDRTLHLLVKDDKGSWVLPSFPVDIEAKEGKKALHETAEVGLRKSAEKILIHGLCRILQQVFYNLKKISSF